MRPPIVSAARQLVNLIETAHSNQGNREVTCFKIEHLCSRLKFVSLFVLLFLYSTNQIVELSAAHNDVLIKIIK